MTVYCGTFNFNRSVPGIQYLELLSIMEISSGIRHSKHSSYIDDHDAYIVIVGANGTSPQKIYDHGHIKDSKTGEAMIGATIMLKRCLANRNRLHAYGFYSLTVSEGTYTMITRFMGFTPFSQQVVMKQNVKRIFELWKRGWEQKTVVRYRWKKTKHKRDSKWEGKIRCEVHTDIPVCSAKRCIKTVQLLPA